MATARTRDLNSPGIWIAHDQLRSYTKGNAKKTVQKLLTALGPIEADGKTVRQLRDYLQTDDRGNLVGFTNDDLTIDKKVRGLVHLIMCLSEFQLN